MSIVNVLYFERDAKDEMKQEFREVETVADIPALDRHYSVVASSPFVKAPATNCFRIILRDVGNKYVVHSQGIPTPDNLIDGSYADNGNYYHHTPEGFAKAWNKFMQRSSMLLQVEMVDDWAGRRAAAQK